jgi:DNA-binding transcriptional MerR regulator
MSHTVGSVARLAGVTVRTLHHYDEIGLLTPSGRSDAGYRRYADPDLERLQRILFFRELGFGLAYEKVAPGLAGYLRDAIVANAARHATG